MAVYNGARHLRAQLESIAAQSNVEWALLISIDGSDDGSREICEDFSLKFPAGAVRIIDGPRRGAAENFRALISLASTEGLPIALCDQDDVWMPDHLSRALIALGHENQVRPVLYGSRTLICAEDLRVIGLSASPRRPLGFSNALVQNVISGHTMVFNAPAAQLLATAHRLCADIVIHDWWIYQVLTGSGGQVIYDEQPSVLYRQHGGNQIGANNGLLASLRRLRGMLSGEQQKWNATNISALLAIRALLVPEAIEKIEAFRAARGAPLPKRLWLIRRAGLRRQGRLAQLSFLLAVLLGKI